MKSCVATFAAVAVLSAIGVSATVASPARDDALVAIARLELEKNFSWQTVLPGGIVIIEGQTESEGYSVIRLNGPIHSGSVARHDSKRVTETSYGWLTPQRLRKMRQPDLSQKLRSPVEELLNIADECAGFTTSGGTATGHLGRDIAEKLWSRYADLQQSPAPAGARYYINTNVSYGPPSGRVEISVSRGQITGYRLHLERTVRSGCWGGPRPVHQIISTTIHSVGTTKVVVPSEAKSALDELDKT